MFLFIDTTEKMTLGLMDKHFSWIDFISVDVASISSQVHKYIFNILEKNACDINAISGLLYCAGPGSYTGMRISEGLSSILEWQGLPIYSFYHFEIPLFCDFKQGIWISKAFKKELFVYEWDQEKSDKKLVKEADYIAADNSKNFCKNESVKEYGTKYTDNLIKKFPQKIFKTVIERNRCDEIFYYRSLEAEFSRK